MKKFLVFALSAFALTGIAFAEGTEEDQESMAATAFVEVPIEVEGVRDMQLGVLTRGLSNQEIGVGETAQFRIKADEGDNIYVEVNGGGDIVLNALHGQVDSEGDPTDGPDDYFNDQNGVAGTAPSMITIAPITIRYRFVENDEEHAVLWGLPTYTANDSYCDTQADAIERCVPDLPPGIGQINVYVGGFYSTTEDQQRGEYEGEVTLRAYYE